MESVTIEICAAEGDPYDRTLGVLIKSAKTVVLARSIRIDPPVRLGRVLTAIDRIVLAWGLPELRDHDHIHDIWEREAEALSGPF